MTNPEESSTQNSAESGSYVGIQGGWVHNSTVYMAAPDASPRQKYETGARFLEVGVPSRARDLITEAIVGGYEDGEVRFHWVLAMLSKRAYRDLSAQERDQLNQIPQFLDNYANDEWKSALEAIHELLDGLQSSGADDGPALKAIEELPQYQRAQVARHLDLMLTGKAKDNLWNEAYNAAHDAQLSKERFDRVWTYFEPDPVEARARKPVPSSITPPIIGRAIAWSVVFAGAVCYLGQIVLAAALPAVVVAGYLIALGAGFWGVRNVLEWHYRVLRLRTKELGLWGRLGVDSDRDGKFAGQVESQLIYYFVKYASKKSDLERWLAATAHIRAAMRDEIVHLYGEDKTELGRVRWLVRYMARDVISQLAKGTLRSYRKHLRTPRNTILWCALSFAVFAPTMAGVVVAAVGVNQLHAAAATFLLLMTGMTAARWWSRIRRERRRLEDDCREYDETLAAREAEYHRWWDKVESRRPNEAEMEAWLNCDKTLLLADALRHYKLAWRDVIAHAFLQTPARNARKARMSGCPWRYSRYDMRLFLVTQDGMREYRTEFDFEHAVVSRNERNNFRFDAVSSVGVIKTSELRYTLKLRLNNGPPSRIRITDPANDIEDNPEKFSELNLDAAGFKPTLHILEGIAAEGKSWIERGPQI